VGCRRLLFAGTADPVRVGHALRWSFLALSLAFAWVTYALLRTRLTASWAFIGAAICAVHQFTAFLSDVCFAELPFAVVTCLFFLISRADSGRRREGVLGLLAAVAYGLRTAGIALFVAWIAESALRGDLRRTAARLVMAALPVLGWHAYVASVEGAPAYTAPAYPYQRADYLFYNVSYARNMALRDPDRPDLGRVSYADLVSRVVGYLPSVPAKLGETVSAPRESLMQQIIELRTLLGRRIPLRLADVGLLLLAALVVGGLVLELVQRRPLLPFYVATYTLLLCVVPWHDQFLNMTTPPEARSFGAFEGTDLLQVMATSLVQRLATETVVGAIKAAFRDRRERQAKEEVDAAIEAWKKEREAAALRERETQEPAQGGSDAQAESPP